MFCHGIIVDVLLRNIDSYDVYTKLRSELDASRDMIHQMQMDILAGIPQYLGLKGSDPWKQLDSAASEPLSLEDNMPGPPMDVMTAVNMGPTNLPVLRITRGIFLLFNLAMAGRMAESGSEIRTTICKIMRVIGRKFGVSMAFLLATALEENRISRSIIDYQKKADAWVVGRESEDPLVGRRFPEFPERY